MPVNPIYRLPTYSVSQSNEANDEERRKEKEKVDKTKKSASKNKLLKETITAPTNQEQTELPSQLIDSEKVIELLSLKPHTLPKPKNTHFHNKQSDRSVKNMSEITQKKLNKSA